MNNPLVTSVQIYYKNNNSNFIYKSVKLYPYRRPNAIPSYLKTNTPTGLLKIIVLDYFHRNFKSLFDQNLFHLFQTGECSVPRTS